MADFLGVLGGMGPLATADFLRKLVKKTPAGIDQEHIPVLLYGDCTIPDRTANIVGGGLSPLPKLLDGIRFLNESGAKVICIPCNSAHCWYEEMQAASRWGSTRSCPGSLNRNAISAEASSATIRGALRGGAP